MTIISPEDVAILFSLITEKLDKTHKKKRLFFKKLAKVILLCDKNLPCIHNTFTISV